MTLTKEQVLYGLRNLVIGDEEQTRIEDCLEEVKDDPETIALIEMGDYDAAYERAIANTMLLDDNPEAVFISPVDCLCWALGFESNGSGDLRNEGTVAAIITLLSQSNDHFYVADEGDVEYAKTSAIELAFSMWNEYSRIANL